MADGKEAFDAYRDQVLSALSGSQTSGEGLKTRLSNLQKSVGKLQSLLADVKNTSSPEEYASAEADLSSIKVEMSRLATAVEELERLLSKAESGNESSEREGVDLSGDSLRTVDAIVEPASPQSTQPPVSALLRNRARREAGSWNITPSTSDSKKNSANPHRDEQDELTVELLQMARRLKHNNLALHEMMKKDKKVMEDTDLVMATNTSRFDAQHKDLKAYSSASWATTWKLLLITLFVVLSVILMFMLILITRSH